MTDELVANPLLYEPDNSGLGELGGLLVRFAQRYGLTDFIPASVWLYAVPHDDGTVSLGWDDRNNAGRFDDHEIMVTESDPAPRKRPGSGRTPLEGADVKQDKPSPLRSNPCPKCGKPMAQEGTIGARWEICLLSKGGCGHKQEGWGK